MAEGINLPDPEGQETGLFENTASKDKTSVCEGKTYLAENGMQDILSLMQNSFLPAGQDIRSYSPLVLAYLGDAVYELIVRSYLAGQGNCAVNRLHSQALNYVKAGAQAAMAAKLQPFLTEEEKNAFRRGRNANPHTVAKHASLSDYRHATGFEALLGYLYVKGETARLLELIRKGFSQDEGKGEENESD